MPDPAVYARKKQLAEQRAATHGGFRSGGASTPAFTAQSPGIGPRAVLFGSLDEEGLNAKAQIEAEGLEGQVSPSDTTGAIGPNQYVEFSNDGIRAYERSNLAPSGAAVNLSKFTGGNAVCDPQIKYDPQAKRWFYAALRCDGTTTENRLYLGFSKTSDPRDFSIAEGHGWCGYQYNTGKSIADYPKLGLDSQHVIIGANGFSAELGGFEGASIFAGPKPAPVGGNCPVGPTLTHFGGLETSLGSFAFTPEPATVADSSPNGYVVAADVETEANIMLWQVTGTAEAPKLTALGDPKVPLFGIPPAVPQPGSTDAIDSLDARLTQAVAAADPNAGGAEAVWTQHTIEGGAGSVVRWYEIVPSELEVKQVGTISDPSKFVFNGAIAPTLNGGAVISYDTGSSSDLVRVMAQSRIGSAPLGTMNTPIELGSSAAVDSDFTCPSQPLGKEVFKSKSCRWGDYAGASVDPTNANVVWGSNQFDGPPGKEFEDEIKGTKHKEHGAQWSTRNFALEPNDLVPTASFTIAPNPATVGLPVSFNGGASSDPDGTIASYSWKFGDGASGTGVVPTHTYGAPGEYAVTLTVTDNGGITGNTTRGVTVKRTQTISFTSTPPSNATVGGPTYTVTATGGGSGNPVAFTIDGISKSVCSISASTVSFIGAGTCTIDANQAGSAEYQPAPEAKQSFPVVSTPAVLTNPASSITQTTATLDGTVNPNGSQVIDCHFDYGTTTSYGASVPCTGPPGAGTSPVAVSAPAGGLIAGTTYHFRAVAASSRGTSYGADQTFATLTPSPLTSSLPGAGVLPFQLQKPAPPVPDAELASRSLEMDPSGTVAVRLSCPASESSCAGTITLRTLAAVASRRSGYQAKKPAILTLAVASFKVAGGRVATVKLHVSARARKLLARTHGLRARATMVAHDPAGATHTTQAVVTLRVLKSARHH